MSTKQRVGTTDVFLACLSRSHVNCLMRRRRRLPLGRLLPPAIPVQLHLFVLYTITQFRNFASLLDDVGSTFPPKLPRVVALLKSQSLQHKDITALLGSSLHGMRSVKSQRIGTVAQSIVLLLQPQNVLSGLHQLAPDRIQIALTSCAVSLRNMTIQRRIDSCLPLRSCPQRRSSLIAADVALVLPSAQ